MNQWDENHYITDNEWLYMINRARNIERVHNEEEAKKGMNMTKRNLNKFYCAAKHISTAFSRGHNDAWTRSSEPEAIAHAKQILEMDSAQEAVVIVKVVAVVRRAKQPISVERIK
jgi:hypothetical protein